MSLIHSAKLNVHDPNAYLKDVPTRLSSKKAGQTVPNELGRTRQWAGYKHGSSNKYACQHQRLETQNGSKAFT